MSILSIPKDCFEHITENFSFVNLLATIYTCKYFYEAVPKSYFVPERHIQKYCLDNHIFYENFKARLSERFFVFGGFMYGVVTRKKRDEKSDIDISHYDIDKSGYITPIKKVTLKRGERNTFIQEYDNCDVYLTNKEGTGCFLYPLHLIKEDGSSSDHVTYQHLSILEKSVSIEAYMEKYCDFDCTKIYYDGKRIKVKNSWLLFKNEETINIFRCYGKTFRYFNWDERWTLKWYYDIYNKNIDRINKYRKRGTKINVIGIMDAEKNLKNVLDRYFLDSTLRVSRNKLEYMPKIKITNVISPKIKKVTCLKFGLMVDYPNNPYTNTLYTETLYTKTLAVNIFF